MCGRYTNTAGPEELNERFRVPINGTAGTHRYNIAPTEEVLAIVAPKGEPEAELMRWGLVPSWANDLKSSAKMINARIETVTEKPAYRRLIGRGQRRALQIADGYYEWLKPERKGEPRQPFHFQVDGGIPFAFASIWTPAKVEGEWIHSISLLTCDSAPNRTAAAIHGRMPVILADQQRAARMARPGPRRGRSPLALRRAAGRAPERPPRQSGRQQGGRGSRGARAALGTGLTAPTRARSAAPSARDTGPGRGDSNNSSPRSEV